ncbi:MAG: hypothetical protein RL459_1336 [Pseudomonadota bacterium]|jgi:cyanophycinase-like exopeptidase
MFQEMISHRGARFGLACFVLAASSIAMAAKAPPPAPATTYTYKWLGDPEKAGITVQTNLKPSFVLMGGGPDVDEGFRWLIKKAGITPATGGRLVVIRATGTDAYNPYIYYSDASLSPDTLPVDQWVGGAQMGLSSVETLIIPTRAAANDLRVNQLVARANVVWIAGGDQKNYIEQWKGTALEDTLKAHLVKNTPMGGTSAGLAVMGAFDFAALKGTVTSLQAQANPYNTYMTLDPSPLSNETGFISPLAFKNIIFDSHLDERDRMGRLITFMARAVAPNGTTGCGGGYLGETVVRGIGLGVETALLVEGDGAGTYTVQRQTNVSTTSTSAAYFVKLKVAPSVCLAGKPLSFPSSAAFEVQRLDKTGAFINLDASTLPVFSSGTITNGVLSPATRKGAFSY